jgi:ABC-2 type transport system permease protein
MRNSKIAVIAKKEFFDSMKSRTFLIIFGIFLALMIASSVTGVNSYNNQLEQYQKMQAETQYTEEVFVYFPEPELTAVLFQDMIGNIGIIGSILAIILGYNAVSGEKERGNLKLLLSYPLYREDVINGKFLGKIGVLVLTLAITSILSVAVALIMGINLTFSDLVAIMVFMGISTVYLTTFLGISIFFSTISKNGTSSMLNSFMFWIVSAMVITSFSGAVADAVVPVDETTYYGKIASTESVAMVVVDAEESFDPASGDEGDNTFEKYQQRWKVQNMIESFISPTQNFEQIGGAVLGNDVISMLSSDSSQSEMGMSEILLGKINNIITMLVWMIVSLVATYLVFMRQDIR